MGSHICRYCHVPTEQGYDLIKNDNVFHPSSSGDVVLKDARTGIEYMLPDMALHYVHDHGWQPPEEFVTAVMTDSLQAVYRMQTKGIELVSVKPVRIMIGYLEGDFPVGPVPERFLEKLEQLFISASPDREIPYRR